MSQTLGAKTVHQWFDEYAVCHQHPTNKLIHWICVPTITVTLLALLWAIPVPATLAENIPWFNWALPAIAASLVFYNMVSPAIGAGMTVAAAIAVALIIGYEQWTTIPLWQTASGTFVAAWIGQFIGHQIEGRTPAFFQDLQYLLIGPAWLLGFVYRAVGIRY